MGRVKTDQQTCIQDQVPDIISGNMGRNKMKFGCIIEYIVFFSENVDVNTDVI